MVCMLFVGVRLCPAQCVTTPVDNLVRNGNFSSGNTQFTSGYSYCSAANCLYPEGYFAVGTNANTYHGAFVGRDHTTGTGNFMVVNGTGITNTTVWSETITVKPGTNYNFSSWVMTLVASSPARLQFQINGITIGAIFNAPSTSAVWQNFFVTWNSGATTSAVITILNQNTTLSGNDFGIDDISFIEICGTTQPNLGPDRLLCGIGNITVDTNVPHTPTTNINWSDGQSGSGLGAPYTKTFTTAGTYWVCVQDGSCYKTDTIVINANFAIEIGSDFTLCASTAVLLDAVYANAFTTYQWFLNGTAISDSTLRTFTVRSPGTYRVEVTDASCGLMRFDQVVVNAVSAIPIDRKYCPPAQALFEVTPNPTGGFKWYDAPLNGNFMGNGNTLSLTTTGTKTMYAQDTTGFQYAVGPNTKFTDGFDDAPTATNHIVFDALSSFTLDEVTVFARVYSVNEPFTIGITVRDLSGVIVGQIIKNVTGPPIVPVNHDWPFTIIMGTSIPAGLGYKLSAEGTIGNILFWSSGIGNTVDWINYKINNVIEFKGLDAGYGFCYGKCYGFAYNWKISKGNSCARVPVVAQELCPLPLTWLSFDVTKEEQGTLLTWTTASEKNTAFFVIEYSSDGKKFLAMDSLSATSNSYNAYSFVDPSILQATRYYRIVQYDTDNHVTYSSIKVVVHEKLQPQLYPTVHQGQFFVSMPFSTSSLKIIIFDCMGKEVYSSNASSCRAQEAIEINLPSLASGVYLVKTICAEQIFTVKTIKE